MYEDLDRRGSGRLDRRQLLKGAAFGASGAALGTQTWAPVTAAAAGPGTPFDFDTGNSLIEVIIPQVIPVIYGFVSPGANDASLVLRLTTLVTHASFDALAPYHASAVGVSSRLGRRPAHERTLRNKNIAVIYACYRVLNSALPLHRANWRAILTQVGLDPDDNRTTPSSPIGIGNRAGNAVVADRERDGMNQLGDEGGRLYNRQPYADYTGYEPVNTADQLHDAGRWQPGIVTTGNGIFRTQRFVTPQWRLTRPYSYASPGAFDTPPPSMSTPGTSDYQAQADEVLAVSAGLTDYQKAAAELFDDKLLSLGFSALFLAQTRGFTLDQFVQYDFLVNMAAFDAGIACWNEKYKYDAVRPFSAIRHLYGDSPVTAWGGPGRGTVSDLPASQWRSFLGTADHPEYPSGSACFCGAHAEASRLFFGSDEFGWAVPVAQGSSRVEPGLSPGADLVLGPWPTWTAFEMECGLSRLWGGVHFSPSLPAGRNLGRQIGALAYAFLKAHLDGTA